jgi:hypothetical protein
MVEFNTPEEIRQAIVSRIDRYRPLVEDIVVSLYRNPELGLAGSSPARSSVPFWRPRVLR